MVQRAYSATFLVPRVVQFESAVQTRRCTSAKAKYCTETDSEQVVRTKDEKYFEKRVKETLKSLGGKGKRPIGDPGREAGRASAGFLCVLRRASSCTCVRAPGCLHGGGDSLRAWEAACSVDLRRVRGACVSSGMRLLVCAVGRVVCWRLGSTLVRWSPATRLETRTKESTECASVLVIETKRRGMKVTLCERAGNFLVWCSRARS